jgi:general stress protein 26
MSPVVASLLLLGLTWAFQPAHAPATVPAREVVISAAREMMTKARYCALITLGKDGHPQAREIDAFAPEPDMTVWIATNPVTRKVTEITRDARVTLYYASEGGAGYVTILGRAQIVDDPAEKAKRWKDDWAAFYKDRNRGPDYLLIRVRPVRLEIVSYTHKLTNDPTTWRPISIDFPE